MSVVMDSWALLAFFEGKSGAAKKVGKIMSEAEPKKHRILIHEVNLAEFYAALDVAGAGDDVANKTTDSLRLLPVEIVGGSDPAFSRLAAWYSVTYGLPLAAAFTAALAKQNRAELVTGDSRFLAFRGDVNIRWVGDPAALEQKATP